MFGPRFIAPVTRAVRACVLFGVCAFVSGGPGVRAQVVSGEAAAKAKFTITFARFVQWPSAAVGPDLAPLRLCVLHASAAVGAAFAQLEAQSVAGHPVTVLQNPRERNLCELLFVDTSAAYASSEAIAATANLATFTLGAVEGFLSQGGMVELVNVNDALRFDVNLRPMRSAHLAVSSQVLKLARQVRE